MHAFFPSTERLCVRATYLQALKSLKLRRQEGPEQERFALAMPRVVFKDVLELTGLGWFAQDPVVLHIF